MLLGVFLQAILLPKLAVVVFFGSAFTTVHNGSQMFTTVPISAREKERGTERGPLFFISLETDVFSAGSRLARSMLCKVNWQVPALPPRCPPCGHIAQAKKRWEAEMKERGLSKDEAFMLETAQSADITAQHNSKKEKHKAAFGKSSRRGFSLLCSVFSTAQ